jgi:hypothetical protein
MCGLDDLVVATEGERLGIAAPVSKPVVMTA